VVAQYEKGAYLKLVTYEKKGVWVIAKCSRCNGTGEMECPKCQGRGETVGIFTNTCERCKGRGLVRCTKCSGVGQR